MEGMQLYGFECSNQFFATYYDPDSGNTGILTPQDLETMLKFRVSKD